MMRLNPQIKRQAQNPLLWVGGALLIGSGVYVGLSGGPAANSGRVFSRSNESSLAEMPQRAGLAPGHAMSETASKDSLSIWESEPPAAHAPASVDAPEAPEAKEPDFIAALEKIEKKSKPMPRGAVAKLKKMLFGSSGSGGSSASLTLSNPKSSLQTRHSAAAPAGTLNTVQASRDFRSAYGEAAKDLGATTTKARSQGLLSSAQSKAANVFKNLFPGTLKSKGTHAKASLSGGFSDKAGSPKSPSLKVPAAPKGKPVDKPRGTPASSATSSPRFPSFSNNRQPGYYQNPQRVQYGRQDRGGRAPKEEKRPPQSDVSPSGLLGDAAAMKNYGEALFKAGSAPHAKGGGPETSPAYTGAKLLSAAKGDEAKVSEIRPYDPSEINDAAHAGHRAPAPPQPRTAKIDKITVGWDPSGGRGASLAEQWVTQAYTAHAAADQKASAYQAALKANADAVLKESEAAAALSEELLSHKDLLEKSRARLNVLGRDIESAATEWQQTEANPLLGVEAKHLQKTAIGNKTQAKIKAYETPAHELNMRGGEFAASTAKAAANARTQEEKTISSLDTARTEYQASLQELSRSVQELKNALDSSKDATIWKENAETGFKKLYRQADAAFTSLRAGEFNHQDTQAAYDDAALSVKAAAMALRQSYNPGTEE